MIWTEPYSNLSFLPSVANNRLVNTHEILTSDAANALFNKLRSQYEYVIIDLSPLAPIVDARTTTQFIDSYILVVEWGRTRVEDVERALADAKAIQENLLGVVLNKNAAPRDHFPRSWPRWCSSRRVAGSFPSAQRRARSIAPA